MAINPLQLPSSQAFTSDLNLGQSLAQLGQVYKQAQNQQKLSDLGKGLANGTLDYRAAAAQTADMGDVTHTLQFLALAEQRRKEALGVAADDKFDQALSGLGGLYGAKPGPSVPAPNPAPVPGAAAPIPAVPPGAPVPSSARVVGDAEGVASGLYDPPKAPGQRPPVQLADAGSMPPVVAPAAPPASAAVTTPTGQIGAEAVPSLLQAMSSRNVSPERKEVAKMLLTEAFKNMKEPDKIQTLRALQSNPALLDVEKQLRAAGKTEINIDQKGETALAQEGGKALAKRFEKLSEEGDNAKSDLALIGQLRDLGTVVQTGAPAAIQSWLAERGVKVGDNVGAVEAYGSIIDKLTPQQRVPGSGATSDYEGRMFKNSLPKLINTPEGNEIISNTLAGLAQYKLDRAAIAERALTREITPSEALKQMRELPSPYQHFKDFAKTGFKADPNNPATAAPASTKRPDNVREVPMTKIEIDQSLANARAAVARNPAARDAIIKKLRDNNIDPSSL